MICKKCEKPIAENSMFCVYCGAKIEHPENAGREAAVSNGAAAFSPAGSLDNTAENHFFAPAEKELRQMQNRPVWHSADRAFQQKESYETSTAGRSSSSMGQRDNFMQNSPVYAAPKMKCPHCGAQISSGSTYCTECGCRMNGNNAEAPAKTKKLFFWISAAAIVCIAVIASILLLANPRDTGNVSVQGPKDREGSVSETATRGDETVKNETQKTATNETETDTTFLIGTWYLYTKGQIIQSTGGRGGAEVMKLSLSHSKKAELAFYVMNSDVVSTYSGTWVATVLSDNTVDIKLQLVGGYSEVGTSLKANDTYNVTMTVRVEGKMMTVLDSTAAQAGYVGRTLERDLSYETWSGREAEALCSKYESFFYSNYKSKDLVCLADVTHDGDDEMIVVHFCDNEPFEIDGYVYTIDENDQIKLIYSRTGYPTHIGGFFNWYIKKTSSGYFLASEEGFWSTCIGELTFHEYYLTKNGAVCDISSVSVCSSDYASIEESGNAYEVYAARMAEMKSDFYTIYSCPQDGYDKDTIGMYPMSPSNVFSR